MVQISFTNIIVDQFSYGKKNPFQKFIYFLTHMHSDHYQGITPNWNYGKIYCSPITRKILFNKFPTLQAEVIPLELDITHKIVINEENNISVQVNLMDANHCAGSVMILFRGYMGTILHTGDIRFDPAWLYNNKILYPDYNQDKQLKQRSIHVDELIFDNTFCDQIFKFPKREVVLDMIVEIILKNPQKRVLICIDSIGKEELVIALAEKFQTLIVVNEDRFSAIRCMDLNIELFTTNRSEGWIEIIRKSDRKERLENDKNTIAITATGWANVTKYASPDDRNYIVPYSLHSNYEEIETFVCSICPNILKPVVEQNLSNRGEKIRNITQFSSYMISLMHLKQRGLQFFEENYTQSVDNLSESYKELYLDIDKQRAVMRQLNMEISESDLQKVNSDMFEKQVNNKFGKNRQQRNGAKINQQVQLDQNQQKITSFLRQKQESQKQAIQEEQKKQQLLFQKQLEERKLKLQKQQLQQEQQKQYVKTQSAQQLNGEDFNEMIDDCKKFKRTFSESENIQYANSTMEESSSQNYQNKEGTIIISETNSQNNNFESNKAITISSGQSSEQYPQQQQQQKEVLKQERKFLSLNYDKNVCQQQQKQNSNNLTNYFPPKQNTQQQQSQQFKIPTKQFYNRFNSQQIKIGNNQSLTNKQQEEQEQQNSKSISFKIPIQKKIKIDSQIKLNKQGSNISNLDIWKQQQLSQKEFLYQQSMGPKPIDSCNSNNNDNEDISSNNNSQQEEQEQEIKNNSQEHQSQEQQNNISYSQQNTEQKQQQKEKFKQDLQGFQDMKLVMLMKQFQEKAQKQSQQQQQ